MAWNSPGAGNKNGRQGPPCLETVLRKFFASLRKKVPEQRGPFAKKPVNKVVICVLVTLSFVGLWALSGVYSVDDTEQAVILQLGQYKTTETTGLHWYPRLIDTKFQMDVMAAQSLKIEQTLLTRDGDLVGFDFELQYRISDLKAYLFNSTDVEAILTQIGNNAARQVVMNQSFSELTMQQDVVRKQLQQNITAAIAAAHLGVVITDLTLQPLHVPEQFKQGLEKLAKLDSSSSTAEDAAKVQAAEMIAKAQGDAEKLIAQANADKKEQVYAAQGEVAGFNALLPLYLKAPKLVTAQLYYDTMAQVFENSHVVITDVNNFTYTANKDESMIAEPATLPSSTAAPSVNIDASPHVAKAVNLPDATAYQRWQEAE